MVAATVHLSVLLPEALEGLRVKAGGVYIDATLGGAGHTRALLEACAPDGRVYGVDRDPAALARAGETLADFGDRFRGLHGNFADVEALARDAGVASVDGVLMDLGVSSDQLDTPERGFSFRFEGPLDMRMDPTRGVSAAEWLAAHTEEEIADTIYQLGEERQSRRIARAVVKAREAGDLNTTSDLAEVVERAVGGRKGARIHPATRTFQALRMAVNEELESIERGVESALRLLKDGGRLAVITFHSLEDRLVKQIFRRHEGREESLYEGGSVWRGEEPRGIRVTRKPVTASEAECAVNSRARSAKLRILEKGETS
ncbi:MAG: 16S rRNA (cytosine(1402)-N(4))-methyltransferase RsmH [Verrucomicrobia bacterium]|nr:16S rRNA (cytosine(1402)-N(4))-methyltransferase RsmH [Verrucomicrobiota bacterium]MCH8525563.1 16S rRNA (cytosine(1402)-N(4))-methyltransferase RsmH [Kiritimatiellia bacterium]